MYILALLHWEITVGVKTTNFKGANSYSTKALCCCRRRLARKGSIVKVASSVVEARREREFWEGQQQPAGISWDAVRLLIVVRAVEVLG